MTYEDILATAILNKVLWLEIEDSEVLFAACGTEDTQTFWHVYVLGGAYFVWPWKSRPPYRDIVTSQRGHWPLLIRTRYVCTFVGAGSGMGGGIRKIKAVRWGAYYYSLALNAQPCKYDMYKSSLRHIHDLVLSSLKMKGIRLLFSSPRLEYSGMWRRVVWYIGEKEIYDIPVWWDVFRFCILPTSIKGDKLNLCL
jgi:hypothetical protein